jgi:hypothetical protein
MHLVLISSLEQITSKLKFSKFIIDISIDNYSNIMTN